MSQDQWREIKALILNHVQIILQGLTHLNVLEQLSEVTLQEASWSVSCALAQVHGHHPSPAAEADVHGDPCGDRRDLDSGSASRLPSVLLLSHRGAARTHRLLHRLA